MSKPARPGLKFNDLDEMVADASQLRGGSYEMAGRWDLPFILGHLSKTMMFPFQPGGKNIPWPFSLIPRFFYNKITQSGKYPKMKVPMPKFFKPADGVPLENAWEEFVAATDRVKSAPGPTMECPPLGTVPTESFQKMQLLHGAHHLSFLKLK